MTGSFDHPPEVLARLERCHCEDVVSLGARPFTGENCVDAVRDDANPLPRNARERYRFVPRELGDGDDRISCLEHTAQAGSPVQSVPEGKGPRGAEEREVVDRDHGRDTRAPRAAKRRAMQHVERPSGAREAFRVPQRIADDARRAARTAERDQLQVEAGAPVKRRNQPSDMTSGPRASLDQGRDVDSDLHSDTPSRSATNRTAERGSG